MWLRRHHLFPHPRIGPTLGIAIPLLLAPGGHHLVTAAEGVTAVLHIHCSGSDGRCITHPADACDPLTPWKTSGGDGGDRFERAAAPIVALAGMFHTCAIPDDPVHHDPPDVRRALLQVYRN